MYTKASFSNHDFEHIFKEYLVLIEARVKAIQGTGLLAQLDPS